MVDLREQTRRHQLLLELLDLRQVHLTEEVRRCRPLSFPTQPSVLSVSSGRRPCSRPCSSPTLEVAVTPDRSEQSTASLQSRRSTLLPTWQVTLEIFTRVQANTSRWIQLDHYQRILPQISSVVSWPRWAPQFDCKSTFGTLFTLSS